MAAILPFLESEQYHFPDASEMESSIFAGLGAKKAVEYTDRQLVASSNVEMTRLLWTRTLLQEALSTRTFRMFRKGNFYKIELSEAFDRDTIPWARTASKIKNISLFSTNSKMRCPTFDLPAGAGEVGGSCPAAGPAQTTSIGRGIGEVEKLLATDGAASADILSKESSGRVRLTLYPEVDFALAKSVCSYCYATGGKYGEPTVQIAELVRYAVVRAAVNDARLRANLIDAIVWQIPNLPFARWQVGNVKRGEVTGVDEEDEDSVSKKELEKALRALNIVIPAEPPEKIMERMAQYPRVVRIHSSGDFYNMAYARMWIEIANRLYAMYGMSIMLWAPTRTQVLDSWGDFWKKEKESGRLTPNFVIRPSAYHLGDAAPYKEGLALGTSVLTPTDSAASKGIKFDHQCGVYDLEEGRKTCVDALSPDGNKGCRACWVRGDDLRINYVAH